MAINFPASPSTNDTHTENAITWIFNGTSWDAQGDQVTAASIGLGNVDNTADADKPVSTATHTALNLKADDADLISHTSNTSNPHSVTAAQVGLGFHSVKNYGATGDDFTDDTTAIQDALDAASAAGGGTVYFPAGTYRVDKIDAGHSDTGKWSLSVSSNVTLLGEGRDSVTIKPLDSALYDMPVIHTEDSSTKVVIQSLTVDGNKSRADVVANPDGEDEGINLKLSTKVSIFNVRVINCQQDGIDFDGGEGLSVVGCMFEDNGGNGIHAAGSGTENLTVTNCHFYRNALYRITGSGKVGLSAAGMDVREGRFVTVQGCHFLDNARQFAVYGGEFVKVSNCVFYAEIAGRGGVELVGGTESPADGTGFHRGDISFTNCLFWSKYIADHGDVTFESFFHRARFIGCEFHGSHGLKVNSGREISVADCYFNNSQRGIEILEPTQANWATSTAYVSLETEVTSVIEPDIVVESGNAYICIKDHTSGTFATDLAAGNWLLIEREITINNSTFSDAASSNAVRVDCEYNGLVSGCRFEGTTFGNAAINLLSGADGDWTITDNVCHTAIKCVSIIWGSAGTHTITNNNFPLGTFTLASSTVSVFGNRVATINLNNVNPSGGIYRNNEVLTSVTSTAALEDQTWSGNYGAGAEAENGTVALVAGTATVSSNIVPSGATISLTRQVTGGTVGHLTVGTITAGTSFVIDSSSATDTSTIFWKIEA